LLIFTALLLCVGIASAALTFDLTRLSNPEQTSGTPDGLESGGDRHNSYAWCMDVFNTGGVDYLYVGSNRDLATTVLRLAGLSDAQIELGFNGDIPTGNSDLRPRIYRQRLDGNGPFEQVYVSPPLGSGGLPIDIGYRGMAMHQGDLYVVTLGNPGAYSRVLRFSSSGGSPDEVFRLRTSSLRAIGTYEGQLLIGTEGGAIYAAASPPAQPPLFSLLAPDSTVGWTEVADQEDLGANGPTQVGVWEFESFQGDLYVSLGEAFQPMVAGQGFRLYRGENLGIGEPGANASGWRWTPVIDAGAAYPRGLGDSNNASASLETFGDHLYIGTFMDVINQLDTGTVFENFTQCQIYRMDVNGTVEMVIGDTNTNFPTRIGNYRAGFYETSPAQDQLPPPENQTNLGLAPYLWWMESTGDKLFVSTFDVRVFLQYLTPASLTALGVAPADQATILELLATVDQLNTNPAGFDLFVTQDGANFEPITQNGFNDAFNYGGRTILSTSEGVMVGTANPFYGCQVYRLNESAEPPPTPTPTPSPTPPAPPAPGGAGGGTAFVSDDGGSSCFIATAAFGTPLAPQIDVLRRFRDQRLLTNRPGRAFVGWYYENGPAAAAYMNAHPTLKPVVRFGLYPVIGLAWTVNTGAIGLLLPALIAALIWRRRRRAQVV
jgi:hypothetical protein